MTPSPRRHLRRAALVASAALVAAVALAGPASAHVTVVPGTAQRGGDATLSFSVPNEKDNASTVQLEVNFPTDTPIASVLVQPVPGWTWTAQTTTLAKPITTDDGTFTQVVSKITWTGGQIKPGEFQLFTISASPMPTKGSSVVFKVLQTYSDGDVVRWIETPTKGAPAPQYPAPTLRLVGRAKSG